jgi:hypothetical protein
VLVVFAAIQAYRRSKTSGHVPAPAPVASTAAAAPPAPSFRDDVLPTLERHCSDPKGCHGFDGTDSVNLDLTHTAAYHALVGHESEVRKDAMLVVPGTPDASFLLDKLSGHLRQDEGKRMPLDAVTGAPIEPSPISSAFMDDVLVPWIRNGAKEN